MSLKDYNLKEADFSVIDPLYWVNFGTDGLETSIANKREELAENEQKEVEFWNRMSQTGITVPLTNDTVIKGEDIKRLGGYKALCAKFNKFGYDAFDDEYQEEEDLGFGETRKKTNFKAIDHILTHYGFKAPKGKKALREYRNIFWVTRRSFKMKEHDEVEIEELERLLNAKQDEINSFDPTTLNDFLEKDETNIDFFGLE